MKTLFLPIFILALLLIPAQTLLAADALDAAPIAAEEFEPFDDPFAEEEPLQVYDPLEPVNRGIFWVNDKLYFYLFKPIARGWRIVPGPGRVSLSNAFSNLATPIRLTNALLQCKFAKAGGELYRFLVNSTLGLGGLFDPAAQIGVKKHDEDLGQTFGHYGIGSGPYLVLPILGPSNLRDGIGRIGDSFLDPLPYALRDEEVIAAKITDAENELSLDKDTYEGIVKHEIDPYLFIRNAYEQRRAAKVRQ